MVQTSQKVRPGGPRAGFRIGVLALDTCHVLSRGNVQNAETFRFPVLYEIVRNVSLSALMRADVEATHEIVKGALALEAAGVGAIVGACGSFANFQSDVADSVSVPVFMSILLEVPMLLRALPTRQKLGIVFASTHSFTDRVRRECGIADTKRVVSLGADSIPAFKAILAQETQLDGRALEDGLVALARTTQQTHPDIGMWLFQCSDLPPYAAAVSNATGLPVFDMAKFIDHVHSALSCRSYDD